MSTIVSNKGDRRISWVLFTSFGYRLEDFFVRCFSWNPWKTMAYLQKCI